MKTRSPAFIGATCAALAVIFFSYNDMAIKFLSGTYALHEVVLIRSLIALVIIGAVIAPWNGGWAIVRTRKLHLHLVRGMFVVVANIAFFMGLAALPLADAVAIFFVSPLVISIFSVIFLGERVGLQRWAAILVGLIGVIVILRPGTSAFQLASLLPLGSAVAYAGLHMMTRRIGSTESAATMAFYIQITFVIVSVLIGLAIGDGRYADQPDPSMAFFFRGWVWPDPTDYLTLFGIGVGVAFGGYFISQAYRVAEAAYVAPFEYLAMPLSMIWGAVVFSEYPDGISLLGISLILGSGLFTMWRESRVIAVPASPRIRR